MHQVQNINLNSLIITNKYSITGNCKNVMIDKDSNIILNINSLSSIRKLSNLEKIKSIEEYFCELNILNITGSVHYRTLLGNKKSKEYNSYLKNKIEETLKLITNYHTEIFPVRKSCYVNLNQVMLDNKSLEMPVYNHAWITGRTSITSGFNFLTMKKDKRKLLKSSNGNALVEVDFKSCEPFFYLKSNNYNLDLEKDVYQWISSNYGVDMKSRDKFKRGILSILYGANEYTTSKVMQIDQSTVKRIKNELGIYKLKQRLEEEYANKNLIFNYYGRPITSDNNLVNYWIQSSTVDFCSLAFNDFCITNNLRPSFFIHDSMTFEVEKERLEDIISYDEIKDPVSNISIPVEFNVLSK